MPSPCNFTVCCLCSISNGSSLQHLYSGPFQVSLGCLNVSIFFFHLFQKTAVGNQRHIFFTVFLWSKTQSVNETRMLITICNVHFRILCSGCVIVYCIYSLSGCNLIYHYVCWGGVLWRARLFVSVCLSAWIIGYLQNHVTDLRQICYGYSPRPSMELWITCLLYTSDAADE